MKKNIIPKPLIRAFALIGAVLLVGLYLATLVASLSDSPNYERLLMGSLATTFFIPALIYVLQWLNRFFSNK